MAERVTTEAIQALLPDAIRVLDNDGTPILRLPGDDAYEMLVQLPTDITLRVFVPRPCPPETLVEHIRESAASALDEANRLIEGLKQAGWAA
jgi:hypothetical protein